MRGIMENQWNLSCACIQQLNNSKLSSLTRREANKSFKLDPTKIYRFDVHKCVDIDECLFTTCENGKFK